MRAVGPHVSEWLAVYRFHDKARCNETRHPHEDIPVMVILLLPRWLRGINAGNRAGGCFVVCSAWLYFGTALALHPLEWRWYRSIDRLCH